VAETRGQKYQQTNGEEGGKKEANLTQSLPSAITSPEGDGNETGVEEKGRSAGSLLN